AHLHPSSNLPVQVARRTSPRMPGVQACLPAVPRASGSATPQGVRMAGGRGAHGEEHGVDEPRGRQPARSARNSAQGRGNQRLPPQVREEGVNYKTVEGTPMKTHIRQKYKTMAEITVTVWLHSWRVE